MTRAQSAAHRRITSAYSYGRRPFSAPSLSGRNTRMYSRSIEIFLTGIISDVLRMRLKQAAYFRSVSLVFFLHTHKAEIITALSRLKGLLELVFPPENEEPDLEKWSTLLLCIVLGACDCLTVREHDDVKFLEKCYRKHFRMRPQSSGSANVRPKREWIEICSAVQRVVENVGDPVLIKSVRNFICKVEMEPRTNQAQMNMKQSLYATIIELIAGKPGPKITSETVEGKMVQMKLAEIQKMRQNYAKLSTETWVERNINGKVHPQKPRIVSAVSFKSPYDNNHRKNHKNTHVNTSLGKTKSLVSEITNTMPMRVSPNMGKDISARVAYQQKFQTYGPSKYDKQKRSKWVSYSRPNTAPEVQMDLSVRQKAKDSTKPMSSHSSRAAIQTLDKKKPLKSLMIQSERQTQKSASIKEKTDSNNPDKQRPGTIQKTLTNNEPQSKGFYRNITNNNDKSKKTLKSEPHPKVDSVSKRNEATSNDKKKMVLDQKPNTASHEKMESPDKRRKPIHEISNLKTTSRHLGKVSVIPPDKFKENTTKSENDNNTSQQTKRKENVKSAHVNVTKAKSSKEDKVNKKLVPSQTSVKTKIVVTKRESEKTDTPKKETTASPLDEIKVFNNQNVQKFGLSNRGQTMHDVDVMHKSNQLRPVSRNSKSKTKTIAVIPPDKFKEKTTKPENDNNTSQQSKRKENVKSVRVNVTKSKSSKEDIVNKKLVPAQTSVKTNKIVVNKRESEKTDTPKKETTASPLDEIKVFNNQNVQKFGLSNRGQTMHDVDVMHKSNQLRPVSRNSKNKTKTITVKQKSKTANTRIVSATAGRKNDKERKNKTPRKIQDRTQPSSAPSHSVNIKTSVTDFDQIEKGNNETKKKMETTKQPFENSSKKQQKDHEKEMKKIAMEVLVHQNVKSAVGHKLFKNKDTIDEFFNFLYTHQVIKKFLQSFNAEPYKKWEAANGKPEYFCFLHCFIFRHIDPHKDTEALYVVEKILNRMQCQHLRTPRSFTPLGSMFKGRKSLLQEALEYSRSKTAPTLQNKSQPSSKRSSPHPFSRSYTGTPSKANSNLEATSRSVSLERGKRVPTSSSRCWKCKQKDLAMKISINWGNKCICELLQKEGVHYKLDHILHAVKVNDLEMIKEIVDDLKESNEWNPEDTKAKDALYKSRKLRIKSLVKYFEDEGVEDERLAVQTVCVTCRL